MTIDLFVQRGAGDRPGEDIVDPLISAIPVAIQRGRNELDEQASAPQSVNAETVYRAGVRRGQLARFYDIQNGIQSTAKVTGITHQVKKVGESVQLTTSLRVKRPTGFYA